MQGIFTVYHARTHDPMLFPDKAESLWPDGYRPVAQVRASSFEEVYELTNSIDGPWWKNKGVTLIPTGYVPDWERHPLSSTSVGDVIEGGDWRKVVEQVGFRDLGT
jgi:hypothetical protein